MEDGPPPREMHLSSAPLPQVFNVLRSPEQVECARRAFSVFLDTNGADGHCTPLQLSVIARITHSHRLPLGPDLFYVIARRKVWGGLSTYRGHLHYISDHRKCFSNFHQSLSRPIKLGHSLLLLSIKFLLGVSIWMICKCQCNKLYHPFTISKY